MLLLYAEAIARRSVVGAVGLLVVGGRVDDSDVLVELNIDWTAVAEGDFDFVVAVFVSDFGLGDSALSGVGERSTGGLLEIGAGDRRAGGAGERRRRSGRRQSRRPRTCPTFLPGKALKLLAVRECREVRVQDESFEVEALTDRNDRGSVWSRDDFRLWLIKVEIDE